MQNSNFGVMFWICKFQCSYIVIPSSIILIVMLFFVNPVVILVLKCKIK